MKVRKYTFIFTFILLLSLFKLENVNASTNFKICTNLTEGSYLRITPGGDPVKDVDGKSVLLNNPSYLEILESKYISGTNYYRVYSNYYSNNYYGWIKANWINNCRDYTTDDNYGNQLRNAGFPETYILPLQKLHAVHPNWNFVVSKTNLNWNDALNGETQTASQNLISFSNSLDKVDRSLLSTRGDAYSNGNYIQIQPGWYGASSQTVGFYLDPRNWLNEKTIFMFEQLSFNGTYHTANVIQPLLNGTFMQGSYNYNGRNISYAQTFVEVGQNKNVSAVHLASRVLQEQGSSGGVTINMDGGDGKRYYNHFNILASGSTVQAILSNGLAVAKARGWDNPYLSILGGAATISSEYIGVGQDTNYYEKFNTINHRNLYWHQYMQNVRALPSESISTYKSYLNRGILNNGYTFKIPIYNNMPNATSLSISNNADNTLKSLSVSGCNLNPGFNSSATNYSCNVASTTKQVTVNASQTSPYSSKSGDGVVVLNGNSTKANIEVTAANGNKRIYTITINKVSAGSESPADIVSAIGLNNSANIINNINYGTDVSNIVSNIRNRFTLANVEIKNRYGNVKTGGVFATGDTIRIINGNQNSTFTVSIKGDINGDGRMSIIDLAMIKAKLLGSNNLSGAYFSAADLNKDGKITIIDLAMVKAYLLSH